MDPATTISDAFWTAVVPSLLVNNALTVTIKGSASISYFKKNLYRSKNDYPQVELSYVTFQSKPAVRTFAMNRISGHGDYPVAQRYVYRLTIRDQKGGTADLTTTAATINTALLAVYPHLNVTDFRVTDFQFLPSPAKQVQGVNQLTANWDVSCRPMKSQLVA